VLHGAGLTLRLLFMLAVLRLSGPTLLGQYGLVCAIELVAIYLAGLEFHSFTTRRYARRPSVSRLRLCAACHSRLLLPLAPLTAVVSVAAANALGLDFTTMQGFCLALIVGNGAVSQELGRFMVLRGMPVHSVAMSFIRNSSWLPFVLPFLSGTSALDATLALWAAASVVGTAWGLWVMRAALGFRGRVRMRYLARGLALSRGYYGIATAGVLQANIDRFVLQAFLGPAAVGVLAFFQTLANTLPALVQSAVLNLWLPRLLRAFSLRESDRMAMLGQVCRRCASISLLLSVTVVAAALPLAMLTSHPEYVERLWGLALLLAGQVLLMWSQPLHLALYGAHHDRALLWLSLGALVFALLASIVLVAAFGLVGALVSTPLSTATLVAARWLLLSRFRQRNSI